MRRRCAHAGASGSGFSLVELMIATVILGIGLVMVATIFPVAVDQTREAVQMSIAQSVAKSAEQVLRLRMRTATGTTGTAALNSSHLPGDRPHESDSPVGTSVTDATPSSIAEPTTPSSYDVDPTRLGWQKVPSKHPRCFRAIRCCNMVHAPMDQNNIGYLTPATPGEPLYDPRTEVMLEGFIGGAGLPGIISEFRYFLAPVVSPANPAFADTNPNVSPHWIGLAASGRAGTFPRIDIVDRVFPRVEPRRPLEPLDNDSSNDYPRYNDIVETSTRRYCWVALGAPAEGSAGPEGRPYQLRIVVMYRGELTSRYGSQSAMFSSQYRHTRPTPLTAAEDTLFPRPWLVKFDDGSAATFPDTNYTAAPVKTSPGTALAAGTIICHRNVGDLLPPGAIFVDFELGKSHTVLQNIPYAPNPIDYRQLLVTPNPDLLVPDAYAGSLPPLDGMQYWYPDFPDYAWVVPPPIVRTGSGATGYYFEGNCPVLAVFESHIDRETG